MLNNEEYEIMKTHVEHSIAIVRHLPSLDYVIPVVIGHHERWDGTGYPRKLKGKEIPVGARCLAIADAFDAMTSIRSYKKEYTLEYASQQICAGAGKQFDPELAMEFVKLLDDGVIKIQKARHSVSA
ncbi:Cyclic di-GMP phosphodiesterase [bioreactor metagenome]|uniref:Cyclic di-GMP phosphodiesterase n=1 Tax=bioreactor metagenome TaxID=1076179 RepID=A0A645B3G0_9ZZZZ